jgi:hypothetical protein
MPPLSRFCLVLAVSCVGACTTLRDGTSSGASGATGTQDGGSSTDGSSNGDDASADTGKPVTGQTLAGPGPDGALPTGYCCTANSECRDRNCATIANGVRMCLNDCTSGTICAEDDTNYKCDIGTGVCNPQKPLACRPANAFIHGVKPLGACCTPTDTPADFMECSGGVCNAFDLAGSTSLNPYVCGKRCNVNADCRPSPGYVCVFGPYNQKTCAPQDFAKYTCTQ